MNILTRTILILCLFSLSCQSIYSQKFSEVGLGLGTFIYHGDLTKRLFYLEGFQYSGSLFYRYNFSTAIAAKAQISYGNIQAWDYASGIRNRNLHFKSHIAEFALTGELDIMALLRKGEPIRKISPFLFGGVSVFHFNPKARLDGKWHELQPLGTEGQNLDGYNRDPYSLIQVAIPFGLDLRHNMSQKFFMGTEIGFRKTFTDYIDDVSTTYVNNALLAASDPLAAQFADRRSELSQFQNIKFEEGIGRGDSSDKDWFFLFNIYVTYNFISERSWKNSKNEAF